MPYDGIVLYNVIYELNNKIVGGKIEKIYQPEKDEVRLNIINKGTKHQLLLSCNPSNARVYLTKQKKINPPQPSMFCMLLRKHINSAKIIKLEQPSFERILKIYIQTNNELGDTVIYKLIIEIMGKHSNIIFVNQDDKILDSIKHVPSSVSRIRQIMPGLNYVYPPSHSKKNPLEHDIQQIFNLLINYDNKDKKLYKVITDIFSGISYPISREIIYCTLSDTDVRYNQINKDKLYNIAIQAFDIFQKVKNCTFSPSMWLDNDKPFDFSSLNLNIYKSLQKIEKYSICEMLDEYYSYRETKHKLDQKILNIKKIITSNLERCYKKLQIQTDTLNKVKNREQMRIYGELLTANIYKLKKGLKQITIENYYNQNKPINIKLDQNLTPSQNAQKYFALYAKAKTTHQQMSKQLKKNKQEIDYLESQLDNLEKCSCIDDIEEIINELKNEGYIKDKRSTKKRAVVKSKPLHYVSSDNIDMFVGKNNMQNDYLTLKFANNDDLWLHVKDVPGSHVIVKAGSQQIPENTLIQAAHLAAFYSRAKNSSNVAVDYTLRKNVKKPKGAKPGMVIYENHKTIYITPDINLINKLKKH